MRLALASRGPPRIQGAWEVVLAGRRGGAARKKKKNQSALAEEVFEWLCQRFKDRGMGLEKGPQAVETWRRMFMPRIMKAAPAEAASDRISRTRLLASDRIWCARQAGSQPLGASCRASFSWLGAWVVCFASLALKVFLDAH